MIRLAIVLLVSLLPFGARADTVLAGHPLTAGLIQALTGGSSVAVAVVVPAAIPMGRQYSFLSGRGAGRLSEAAARADAVVTLRSVWPDDPLYPLARRANIRLVEIDAARPLDGGLTGVAVLPDASFPWLGLSNLGRMADIVAADLRRLYPAAAATIDANLGRLKAGLLGETARAARIFAEIADPGVVLLTDRFDPLVADLGLDVRGRWPRDDRDWTPERLAELAAYLRDDAVPVVLHHRDPAPEIAAAVAAGGARLVVLDSFDGGPPAEIVAAVAGLVDRLAAGFGARP